MNKLIWGLLISLCFSSGIFADYDRDGWYLQSFLGLSYSADSDLHLSLADQDNHKQRATWDGRPFQDSLYYTIKIDKMTQGQGWGVEWVHHKIYLKNEEAPLEDFSISDGFNLLYLNRINTKEKYNTRYGAGLVFAHMDVTLAGRDRFYVDGGIGGSYLSGVSAQAAVEKWIWESERHFINAESKLTLSYVKAPISKNVEEYARLWNVAVHFTLGLGSKPQDKESATIKGKALYILPPALHHLFVQKVNF